MMLLDKYLLHNQLRGRRKDNLIFDFFYINSFINMEKLEKLERKAVNSLLE